MNTLEYKPLCTIHEYEYKPSVLFMSMNTSRRTLEYCIQSIHDEPCDNPFPSCELGFPPLSHAGDREVWPKMEYRSRLPGEPSLDHPGVPTGRLGHRAGLKTVGGIFRRFFCGLPALPSKVLGS